MPMIGGFHWPAARGFFRLQSYGRSVPYRSKERRAVMMTRVVQQIVAEVRALEWSDLETLAEVAAGMVA